MLTFQDCGTDRQYMRVKINALVYVYSEVYYLLQLCNDNIPQAQIEKYY